MANLIRQDMADEPPDRLESIKEELESVQSATFWELEDLGYNFEYLTQDRKDQLQAFMEIPIDGGEGGSDGENGGIATETSPATSNPPSRRNRRRMRKGKSSNMLQVSPSSASTIGGQNSSGQSGGWKEAQGDLMTPGSTPSSLRPGSTRRSASRGSGGGLGRKGFQRVCPASRHLQFKANP